VGGIVAKSTGLKATARVGRGTLELLAGVEGLWMFAVDNQSGGTVGESR